MTTSDQLLAQITEGLIVSAQANHGSPLRDTPTIARLAQAGVDGGAAAIRCGGVGGVADVAAVAAAVEVPVIGLTKSENDGVFITPTVRDALAVVDAGATVVATDATNRPRPDGASFADTVEAVHGRGAMVMADASTADEGVAAAEAGADLVGTTLSGYTPHTTRTEGPDLELLAALRAALPNTPIVAEGRYHTPASVADAFAAGASSVVVGTAITDPTWITGTFAAAAPVRR